MLAELIECLAMSQALKAAEDIEQIEKVLTAELHTYTELEFRSDGRSIELITVSRDPNTSIKFFELLELRGVDPTALADCRRFLQFGRGKAIIYKLPVAGTLDKGEVYIRGALPLKDVIPYLETESINKPELAHIQEIARLVGKDHTQILGRDVSEQARYTVFFTNYLAEDREIEDSRILQQCLQAMGVNDAGMELLIAIHALFSLNRPKTLFISLYAKENERGIRAKLDYEGIRVELAAEVLRWAGQNEAAIKLVEWGKIVGLNNASYAGIPVSKDGIDGVRVYFPLIMELIQG